MEDVSFQLEPVGTLQREAQSYFLIGFVFIVIGFVFIVIGFVFIVPSYYLYCYWGRIIVIGFVIRLNKKITRLPSGDRYEGTKVTDRYTNNGTRRCEHLIGKSLYAKQMSVSLPYPYKPEIR